MSDFVKGLFEEQGIDEAEYLPFIAQPPTYFRVNTLKVSMNRFINNATFEFSSTHYEYGFRLDGDVKIGKTLEYFEGYIHPQAFSSMLPVLAFSREQCSLIADVAAAPGSKTSQLAQHFPSSHIYAFDKRFERLSLLVSNLERLGVCSVSVFKRDSRSLGFKDFFDKVLVDAPCSSLGSSLYALSRTTRQRVRDMARIQRKMLLSAFDALKEGGELVYSTCTITEQENEGVIAHLLEERENAKIVDVSLPVEHSRGLSGYDFSSKVARIYPWQVESEAFFVAKITKI